MPWQEGRGRSKSRGKDRKERNSSWEKVQYKKRNWGKLEQQLAALEKRIAELPKKSQWVKGAGKGTNHGPTRKAFWECGECGSAKNFLDKTFCYKCGTKKMQTVEAPTAGKSTQAEQKTKAVVATAVDTSELDEEIQELQAMAKLLKGQSTNQAKVMLEQVEKDLQAKVQAKKGTRPLEARVQAAAHKMAAAQEARVAAHKNVKEAEEALLKAKRELVEAEQKVVDMSKEWATVVEEAETSKQWVPKKVEGDVEKLVEAVRMCMNFFKKPSGQPEPKEVEDLQTVLQGVLAGVDVMMTQVDPPSQAEGLTQGREQPKIRGSGVSTPIARGGVPKSRSRSRSRSRSP
jgi:hypothetical protein